MKRGLVVLVVCLSLLLLLGEEATSQMKMGVGLRTGLNFASMSFDPEFYANSTNISQGGRTVFAVGPAFELMFTPMIGAEVDLMFVSKGAKFTRSTDQASDSYKISELEIPLLFKAKFLTGPLHPYGFVGPSFGFVMSATETFDVPGQPQPDIDLKNNPRGDQVGGIDMSLQFGGGAEYMVVPKLGILLDVRYVLGLTNVYDNSQVQQLQLQQVQTTNPSWKTRGFMIQVGAMYHL
jgi:hypothetical protein